MRFKRIEVVERPAEALPGGQRGAKYKGSSTTLVVHGERSPHPVDEREFGHSRFSALVAATVHRAARKQSADYLAVARIARPQGLHAQALTLDLTPCQEDRRRLVEDQHLEQTWAGIQQRLQTVFPDSIYQIWLADLRPVALKDSALYIEAPAETHEWVRRRFGASIANAAGSVDASVQRVELVQTAGRAGTAETMPTSLGSDAAPSFMPTYSFDRFVIGESNRFAHAAALAVAETPGQAYNPLFVHGPPGVGKTHLLQAIGNYTAAHDTALSVHYITVEAFTNHFMNALKNNELETFKRTYRQVDVLLVDDVQFLEGKKKTAEEFFHTFDAVLSSGAQAVFSSDRHPSEIAALEARLRERFQSGLTVDLHSPDYETRLGILRKLAASDPTAIGSELLEHMATRISGNVHVLEGAFIRVVAFASLVESRITIELIERVLAHLYEVEASSARAKSTTVTIPCIQREAAAFFQLDGSVLCSTSRRREVVYARQVAMYLCRELTAQSLPSIASEFGGRDHTTVLHAHRRITHRLLVDPTTRTAVATLRQAIQNPPQVNAQPPR